MIDAKEANKRSFRNSNIFKEIDNLIAGAADEGKYTVDVSVPKTKLNEITEYLSNLGYQISELPYGSGAAIVISWKGKNDDNG